MYGEDDVVLHEVLLQLHSVLVVMKWTFRIVMATLLMPGVSSAEAIEIPCLDIIGRTAMMDCVAQEEQRAAAQVETALELALAKSDDQHKRLVIESQDKWKEFAQAECSLEGDSYRGGTAEWQAIFACTIEEDGRRTKQLNGVTDFSSH